jgi:hypothetical protein
MCELNDVWECREVEQEIGGCVVGSGGSLEKEKGEGGSIWAQVGHEYLG